MSILTRFKEIMSANVNAFLDQAEDPEKMAAQCLRSLANDLGKVKADAAAVMAEEKRAKRNLDECGEEIDKYQNYAVKALEAGNDDDARKFLEKKAEASKKLPGLQQAYELSHTNAEHMIEMHDKLTADIREMESRLAIIKGKMTAAKAREKINKMTASCDSSNRSISAFERMEEKADQALDRAEAMAELNKKPEDEYESLMAKYDVSKPDIEQELQMLKDNLNK